MSFTDDEGNEETLTSTATDAVAAAPTPNSPATGAPTINGTAQMGETLTADTSGVTDVDGLGNVQYEYQWLADDADIAAATSLTYTLIDVDEGKAIKVQVSFTDDADNAETLTSAAHSFGHGCSSINYSGRAPESGTHSRCRGNKRGGDQGVLGRAICNWRLGYFRVQNPVERRQPRLPGRSGNSPSVCGKCPLHH